MTKLTKREILGRGMQTIDNAIAHGHKAIETLETTKAWNALVDMDRAMRILERDYSGYVDGESLPGFTWKAFMPRDHEVVAAEAALLVMKARMAADAEA